MLKNLEIKILIWLLARLEARHVYGLARADHRLVDCAVYLRERLEGRK